MSTSVIVCVRVRPLSPKEISEKSVSIIDMQGPTTSIRDPKRAGANPTLFTFDYSFWTSDDTSPGGNPYASQEFVYKTIGDDIILKNAIEGYNACLFAYGQTGSGKTYSMMGYGQDVGIIPRLSDDIFTVQARLNDPNLIECRVEVTYLEIYCEKCKCLLAPGTSKKELKVREHPVTGPYVEGLTKLVVHDKKEIENLLEDGNRSRAVAATAMNATSSRSHAIFTITLTQIKKTSATTKTELTSRINLVDLAGSERADRTGATGDTLKEGSNINKSLTTLGKVISALAEGVTGHVPFRDSCLTWLLKDNLMGNSRTVMMAALSPADSNYDETMSTLRYADRAKNLKTKAIKNEDASAKRIRELSEEIEKLRSMLMERGNDMMSTVNGESTSPCSSPRNVTQELEFATQLLAEERKSWTDREEFSRSMEEMRKQVLAELGMSSSDDRKKTASLVNLSEDPMMSEYVVYYLTNETTQIGSDPECHILLQGEGIAPHHAKIVKNESSGFLLVLLGDNVLYMNGKRLEPNEEVAIKHGDRLILGSYHVYRFNDPLGVTQEGRLSGTVNSSVDYVKAMEERFAAEKMQFKQTMEEEQSKLKLSFERRARTASLKRQEAENKVRELEESLRLQAKELNAAKRASYQPPAQTQTAPSTQALGGGAQPPAGGQAGRPSGGGISPQVNSLIPPPIITSSPTVGANLVTSPSKATVSSPLTATQSARFSAMQNVMEAQDSGKKVVQQMQRLPPQLVRRFKVVLLGHEEVGKTSLRKCLLSDPLFFKSLPDVLATTCIEAQNHFVKIPADPSLGEDSPCEMNLRILDFAGQEVYHTHSIFLTNRTLFAFVWKMSAAEQGSQSSMGMSEYESTRLRMWLNDVLAKAPNCPVMLVGTHLDELRDQSPTTIKYILSQAAKVVTSHVQSLKASISLEGNFAISCKGRVVFGDGVNNAKVSALLMHMAKVSRKHCVSDPVFWGGAIPGRHMAFMKKIEEIANSRKKLILPISEFASLATQCGIATDAELLQVSQLFHSWLVLFLFNHVNISANPFVFLHPQWLSRIVSNLFSFSHVLQTPPELRKHIGGLDYSVQDAVKVDYDGLVRYGIFIPQLTSVLFRQSLVQLLNREPLQEDYDTVLQLLVALEVVYTQPLNHKGIAIPTNYIPSLFPHDIPPQELLDLITFLFQKSTVRRSYQLNVFPRECCFRLQCRLNQLIRHMGSEQVPTLRSAWRYAMWLGPSQTSNVRCLLWIVEDKLHYVCTPTSMALDESMSSPSDEVTSEALGDLIDETLMELIREYPGVRCQEIPKTDLHQFSTDEVVAVVEYLTSGIDRATVSKVLFPGLGVEVPSECVVDEDPAIPTLGHVLDKAVQLALARNYA